MKPSVKYCHETLTSRTAFLWSRNKKMENKLTFGLGSRLSRVATNVSINIYVKIVGKTINETLYIH